YAIFDPVLAILVAVNILYQGWKVISQSIGGLMDQAVEPQEEEAIKQAIASHAEGSGRSLLQSIHWIDCSGCARTQL
ncbi:hypothetical protein ACCT04_37365, partial [Rhizobium ruizarguesonis]